MIILDNTDVRLEFSEKLQEFRLNPYPELLPIDPDVYTIIDYLTQKENAEQFVSFIKDNPNNYLDTQTVKNEYDLFGKK